MHIASIGIDLGKNTFHLVALGERNKILLRKKLSRAQLLAYTANVPGVVVPRAAARCSTCTRRCCGWIAHCTVCIVIFIKPIRRPLPHVP